jgi:hypothetical protein
MVHYCLTFGNKRKGKRLYKGKYLKSRQGHNCADTATGTFFVIDFMRFSARCVRFLF